MKTEDILMCPGPNDIADRVIRAMMKPAECPIFEEFQEFYEQTLDMLAEVFQTTNQVIPLPGSGRSGIEASILSLLEPGDKALSIVCGQFGNLAMRVIRAVGGEAVEFASPWGEPVDLEAFKKALSNGNYKLVTMVHNETSTGALYSNAGKFAKLAHEHGALFLLDAISSLGGADLPTDEWEVDLCVACNHKAIAAPIGHAYVAVSDRAWEAMEKRKEPCRTIFNNLLTWKAQVEETAEGRKEQPTQGVFSAVHLFYALHEALKMILEEGLQPRFARHILNARAFREGILALGLKPLAHPDIASPTVTCIPLPGGITSEEFLRHFRQDHGIATLPGIGPYRDTAIRIGHMGVTAVPRCILYTLHATQTTLAQFGYEAKPGTATLRAEEVYA
ncbi:MAG: alanine--glyoxylate aminotransferase family protein, partial [Candidatus Tectomicrobia bacterium]|nr:alanine--glyoxylate aminotransferase family protein [Candidatus Tectomicrobia bacterium]